jgi:hypothetical protein
VIRVIFMLASSVFTFVGLWELFILHDLEWGVIGLFNYITFILLWLDKKLDI